MALLTCQSLADLETDLRALEQNDVLAFAAWRIVLADDPPHPYWLEGHGFVTQVPQGDSAAEALRKTIEAHDTTQPRESA